MLFMLQLVLLLLSLLVLGLGIIMLISGFREEILPLFRKNRDR